MSKETGTVYSVDDSEGNSVANYQYDVTIITEEELEVEIGPFDLCIANKLLEVEYPEDSYVLTDELDKPDFGSFAPSLMPSGLPSSTPSGVPTVSPTGAPTAMPSAAPSETPTGFPSGTPSSSPSSFPTVTPFYYNYDGVGVDDSCAQCAIFPVFSRNFCHRL